MIKETYDDFSQDYDRFVNWQNRLAAETPFLESLLSEINTGNGQPLTVLDAACGTGMHAIELARRGYRAAGADISPKMIETAQRNAQSANKHVTFKDAGFTQLEETFKDIDIFPFDAITCFGNSLPHLTTREDIRNALNDFRECLQPGGMLILQNRNFDAVMAKRERWIGPQSYTEDNKDWLFLRFYDFDADGLITFNIVRLKREGKGQWKQSVSTVRLYPLLKEEMLELLNETGFDQVRTYGKMADEPFDPLSSENLVVSAIKK
jgi:glycine/sarcosine N-methyltransferase